MPANLNWMDIGAILIIAVCAIEGLFKGFILSVFNMVGFFIAIYIGKVAAPFASLYISDNTGIDESIKKYFAEKVDSLDTAAASILQMGGKSSSQVTDALTSTLLIVISFFIVFLLARLFIYIAAGALDMAARLPVLKQFNKMGGLIFGIIKGAALLYVTFALLTPILPLLSPDNPILKAVNQSVFATNFYRYNIIIPWIMGQI